MDEALDGMLAASLRPVCVGLALFYALLTAWYLVQYDAAEQTSLGLPTGLFSLALLAAAVWFERNQLPLSAVRLVTAGIGVAIIFTCLVQLVGVSKARQTTQLMIAQLGFGCLLFSIRWYLLLSLLSMLGWGWVASGRLDDPDWRHFGLALVQATLFGALVLVVRIRAYRSVQTLRMRDQVLVRDLQEANHAVLCAAKAKSQFLANMSHEIRTPMTAMLGMTELLQMTALDERQAEYASTIERSGNTLLQIVNDILDFSKIEAGHLAIEDVGFDLEMVLREVHQMLQHQAQEKQLVLRLEVDDTLPPRYRGDPTRIKQVLINLVGNAIKFTHRGEVTLRAQSTPLDEARASVEIAVTDTGIGIPKEQQERVFEAFTQGDASTTRRYGGTGLGLAISTRLVRLMGGEIKLSSKPAEGSTFTVSMVLNIAGRPSTHPVAAKVDSDDQYHARILVVEDNPDNQVLTERMLRHLGCEVDIASDGAIALERLERATYDLVLMDCHMPNLNGYEATREIRRREATASGKHTTIVALSASVLPEERDRCIEVGMDDYIGKPFTRSDLQLVFRRWLRGPHSPEKPPEKSQKTFRTTA